VLRTILAEFQGLDSAYMPLVVYQVLNGVAAGALSPEQVKQALRDAYDQCRRAASSERGLYSPVAFLAKTMTACLQNQAFVSWLAEDSAAPAPSFATHPAARHAASDPGPGRRMLS
jgi:hypothetical protein